MSGGGKGGIPQAKPLSAGETLGCTAPVIHAADCLVFVADGRFHLEAGEIGEYSRVHIYAAVLVSPPKPSFCIGAVIALYSCRHCYLNIHNTLLYLAAMIQNPMLKAYRYDPYGKVITAEGYDTEKMKANRLEAIHQASSAKMFGVVLGTLGRQGSPKIFHRLRALLRLHGRRCVLFLMAELNPLKLAAITHIEAWVQVSCPRLSIDWGAGFVKVSREAARFLYFDSIYCDFFHVGFVFGCA